MKKRILTSGVLLLLAWGYGVIHFIDFYETYSADGALNPLSILLYFSPYIAFSILICVILLILSKSSKNKN